jgi:predicted amidohydrolase
VTTWDRLHITLVQQAAALEPEANRALLDELAPAEAGLVVFPEAFARGFGKGGSDLTKYAESQDGPFGSELSRVAKDRGATLVAGMFEAAPGQDRPYNTLLVRGDTTAAYRKIHLYDSFGYRESDSLVGGPLTPTVVDIGGVPTGLMTCYDLRFPEHARALVDAGAELLVVPAAWAAGPRKVDHWRTLLRARAIENTVYVAAAAQSAPRYCGHSMVVDPLGDVLVEAGDDDEVVAAWVDRERLREARRINPSLDNRRL